MSLVLGLDSATLTASAAVRRDGALATARDGQSHTHSSDLLTLVDAVVAEAGAGPADLTAIAVGLGPGSFTGLRIGLASAKGLAFALGLPLLGVSSLAALAQGAVRQRPSLARPDLLLVPALDARRGELYAGFYRWAGDHVAPVAPEVVIAPTALAAAIDAARAASGAEQVVVVGDALAAHAAALAGLFVDGGAIEAAPDLRATPSAIDVAALAELGGGDVLDVLERGAPSYIRPSEAEVMYPDGVPGALPR
jgi:tRNA threonylcarbamoyladenosine biosynthesis protein TsaB